MKYSHENRACERITPEAIQINPMGYRNIPAGLRIKSPAFALFRIARLIEI
jgi:hypothetical protein